ncbi:MAG: NAD-dependent epimerase/dehydratase family protein [Candidatus Lokiarchaeota archaeon]|nr:NAD-dependent epimerase/dehydratase family protein [Candidatus Lokiarchaeota archaeon]
MQVLVTGAFGNVGESTLIALLKQGYYVRCFDLPTKTNEKKQAELEKLGDFQTVWGDIRDFEAVSMAALDMHAIIHLAAIIPPASDENPELAYEVNVGGTLNLLKAAKEKGAIPKFIYASSVATYGHCKGDGPPKTASDPQHATDPYTEHKIECERLVKESDLPWTILRFGVVTPLAMGPDIDPIMFEIPLEQRFEFVHTRDIGLACANAVEADTMGKILLLGGGESCRMSYREFVTDMLETMGVGMLPESAFKQPECDADWFHTDWMDTEESQRILKYQQHDFKDFLEEYKELAGVKRHLAKIFRPLIRRQLLAKSPYYDG